MRRGVLSLAVVAALGCQRSAGPSPREPAPEPSTSDEQSEGEGPSLEEIADAIDPGPRDPLTEDLPPWIEAALGIDAIERTPEAMLTAARQQVANIQSVGDVGGDIGAAVMLALAQALILSERATASDDTASVEALLVLAQVYAWVDIPMLAEGRNPFVQATTQLLVGMGEEADPDTAEQLRQLSALVTRAVAQAGDAHRRVVARLLRRAPEHPAIPDVLARLAPRIAAEDDLLAVGVLQRAMSIRGAAATADQWVELSLLCHRTLDTRCGRDALAQAEAVASEADASVQERLHEARQLAKSAHRAVELQDAAGLEDSLERGEALVALERYAEAREVFDGLMRRHPEDARPVVGRAHIELEEHLDFVGALQIVDQAQPTEHRGQQWYELAIGVRATVMLYQLLPQVAGRPVPEILEALRPQLTLMHADIDALDGLGVPEGRVLRFLYDQGMEAWPKLAAQDEAAQARWVQQQLPHTRTLLAEVPDSRHAYLLMLAAAQFSADKEQALAVIDVVPPKGPDTEELVYRRAQAAFDLVATWDADERVADLLRLCAELDGPEQPLAWQRLVVDAQVLARRLGQSTEDWAELERRYRALLEQPGADQDALLLNNLAVVMAERGRMKEAVDLWLTAVEHAEDDAKDLPRLNAVAAHLDPATAPTKGDFAGPAVEQLAESGGSLEVRLMAHAWLVASAEGKQRRQRQKALDQLAADEAVDSARPRHLPRRGGVVLKGSVAMGLGYSAADGMALNLDVQGVPWLVLPSPVPVPDPRRAAPAKTRKRSR